MSQFVAENDKQVRNINVLQPTVLQMNSNAEKNVVTVKSDNATGSVAINFAVRKAAAGDNSEIQPLYESDGVTPLVIDFTNGLTQTFEAPGAIAAIVAIPVIPIGGTYVILRNSGAQ